MPSIPRYSGPQVQAQVLRGGEQRAYDTGAEAIGQGLANVGRAATGIYQQEQERADRAALMAFDNHLSAAENQLLYDGETGVYSKRGVAAMDAPKTLWQDWDSTVGSAVDKLPARVRSRAQELAANRRNDANRGVMRHVMRESDTYYATQEKGMFESAVNDATLNYLDPARVETEASRAMLSAQSSADRMGVDETTRGNMLAQARSGVFQAAIERRLIDSPVEARAEYERVRDYLTGAARAEIETKIRPLIDDEQARANLAGFLSGRPAPDLVTPPPRGTPSTAVSTAIDAAAMKHGVPKEFLYALAEQESSFNPKARGEVLDDGDRAEGVFQYRKTTADEVGLTDRTDPAASADVAARQFRQRMDAHGADYAIAAHFAGEGGASAVVKRGRTSENPKTAAYLAEVKGRAARFRGESRSSPTPAAPARTEAEVMALANAIDDPHERAATIAQARTYFGIKDAAKAEATKALSERTIGAINGNPAQPLSRLLSPADYAALAAEGRIGDMERYRSEVARGGFIQDDYILVDEIEREAAMDPAAFAKRDIRGLATRLSTDTLNSLLSRQAQVGKPGKEADWATDAQRLESAYIGLGIGDGALVPGGPTKGNNATIATLRGEFSILYRNKIKYHTQRYGKEPTPEQEDALLRSAQRAFAERMNLDGKKLPTGKINTPFAKGEQFDLTIPEADRQTLSAEFTERYGRRPTDSEIRQGIATKRVRETLVEKLKRPPTIAEVNDYIRKNRG